MVDFFNADTVPKGDSQLVTGEQPVVPVTQEQPQQQPPTQQEPPVIPPTTEQPVVPPTQQEPPATPPATPPTQPDPNAIPTQLDDATQKIINDRVAAAQAEAKANLMKELGVTDFADARKRLREPETPEQAARRQETLRASVNKYAVEKGYLTNQQLFHMEQLRNTPDRDLVYADFAKSYKEENANRLDDLQDPKPVTEEEVKLEFEKTYHLNSESKISKARGEKLLAADAKELRGGLEETYNKVTEEYQDYTLREQNYKPYKTAVEDFVSKNIPPKLVYGAGEDKVEYEIDYNKLTDQQKHELKGLFMNDDFYDKFLATGKLDESQLSSMKQRLEKGIKYMFHDQIVSTSGKVRFDAGLKSGSNNGGKSPFQLATQEMTPIAVSETALTDEDRARLRQDFR